MKKQKCLKKIFRNISLNQNGLGLIGILIASAMIVTVAMTVAYVVSDQNSQNQRLEISGSCEGIASSLVEFIKKDEASLFISSYGPAAGSVNFPAGLDTTPDGIDRFRFTAAPIPVYTGITPFSLPPDAATAALAVSWPPNLNYYNSLNIKNSANRLIALAASGNFCCSTLDIARGTCGGLFYSSFAATAMTRPGFTITDQNVEVDLAINPRNTGGGTLCTGNVLLMSSLPNSRSAAPVDFKVRVTMKSSSPEKTCEAAGRVQRNIDNEAPLVLMQFATDTCSAGNCTSPASGVVFDVKTVRSSAGNNCQTACQQQIQSNLCGETPSAINLQNNFSTAACIAACVDSEPGSAFLCKIGEKNWFQNNPNHWEPCETARVWHYTGPAGSPVSTPIANSVSIQYTPTVAGNDESQRTTQARISLSNLLNDRGYVIDVRAIDSAGNIGSSFCNQVGTAGSPSCNNASDPQFTLLSTPPAIGTVTDSTNHVGSAGSGVQGATTALTSTARYSTAMNPFNSAAVNEYQCQSGAPTFNANIVTTIPNAYPVGIGTCTASYTNASNVTVAVPCTCTGSACSVTPGNIATNGTHRVSMSIANQCGAVAANKNWCNDMAAISVSAAPGNFDYTSTPDLSNSMSYPGAGVKACGVVTICPSIGGALTPSSINGTCTTPSDWLTLTHSGCERDPGNNLCLIAFDACGRSSVPTVKQYSTTLDGVPHIPGTTAANQCYQFGGSPVGGNQCDSDSICSRSGKCYTTCPSEGRACTVDSECDDPFLGAASTDATGPRCVANRCTCGSNRLSPAAAACSDRYCPVLNSCPVAMAGSAPGATACTGCANWNMTVWSPCNAGTQNRTVTCGSACCIGSTPASSQACPCTDAWTTGAWSVCNAGTQTRTVTCGPSLCCPGPAPAVSQACAVNCQAVPRVGSCTPPTAPYREPGTSVTCADTNLQWSNSTTPCIADYGPPAGYPACVAQVTPCTPGDVYICNDGGPNPRVQVCGCSFANGDPSCSTTNTNGTCGTSHGGTFGAAPAANLCSTGTASAVNGAGPWNWHCYGSGTGTEATCSANLSAVPVNGACGTSHGGTFATAPSTNLCSAGNATAVAGTGPWTWDCTGLNGGTTANCSAALTAGPVCVWVPRVVECFVAGTQIELADGKTKSIEEIQLGDVVSIYDEETKLKTNSPVTEVLHHEPRLQKMYKFVFDNGNGFTVTGEHLIYTINNGYVPAEFIYQDFRNGNLHRVLTDDQKIARVKKVTRYDDAVTTYNIHVKGISDDIEKYGRNGRGHNYFANGILAHNLKWCDGGYSDIPHTANGTKVYCDSTLLTPMTESCNNIPYNGCSDPSTCPQGAAVHGACGTAHNTPTGSAPTTNLCSAGNTTAVSGTGPWTWYCEGTGSGSTDATCTAPTLTVNGACGAAHGVATGSAPSGGSLCSAGAASAVAGSGPWTWTCNGSGGGTTANCNAPTNAATCSDTQICLACFVEGTQVTLPNGKTKNIEDVIVGEKIQTYDEFTGKSTVSPVEEVFHHEEKESELYKFTFSNNSTVTSNDVHLFYSVKDKNYLSAKELYGRWSRNEEILVLSDENELLSVTSMKQSFKKVKLYNLHVTGAHDKSSDPLRKRTGHNYYANGVLVHNLKAVNTTTCAVGGMTYNNPPDSCGAPIDNANSKAQCCLNNGGVMMGTTPFFGWNCSVTCEPGDEYSCAAIKTCLGGPGVGTCGSANGTPVASAPSSNLCSAGTATPVAGTGPWTWECVAFSVTASCSAPVAAGASCTLDGKTVAHGASDTFYSASSVACGGSCATVAQTRNCNNGTLDGSAVYDKATCSVAACGATCSACGSLGSDVLSGANWICNSLDMFIGGRTGQPMVAASDGTFWVGTCSGGCWVDITSHVNTCGDPGMDPWTGAPAGCHLWGGNGWPVVQPTSCSP